MAAVPPTWVVLAGGRAERMGAPKPDLDIAGRRLIDLVLAPIPAADPVIVVGPPMALDRPVRFCLEEPRFGGPVAALAAALPHVTSARLVLIAVDMPWATPLALRLLDADPRAMVIVPVDADGKRQPLCSVWRTEAARHALDAIGSADGVSMHRLLAGVDVIETVVLEAGPLRDLDTPADLRAAAAAASETASETATGTPRPHGGGSPPA